MPAALEDVQIVPIRRARVGLTGRLVVNNAASAAMQRLMAMGLVPGLLVTVIRVAPLGDPIVLETKGFQVSLRKGEAEGLSIEQSAA